MPITTGVTVVSLPCRVLRDRSVQPDNNSHPHRHAVSREVPAHVCHTVTRGSRPLQDLRPETARHHSSFSRYQSTVFAMPLSNCSRGVKPNSLSILLASIA
jgi:hypothetical protein